MKYVFLILALFLFGCGSSNKQQIAPAAAPKVEAKAVKKESKKNSEVTDSVTCKHGGGDVRKIEVVENAQGCVLQYTKSGAINEVATGSVGSKHCQTVSDRIVSKLSDAGYKCQ